MIESVASSGAAAVAEGDTKPGSTLSFESVTERVVKLATFLGPVSDELLEDAPSLSGYLNSRLSLFIQAEEEKQILNGHGAGPQLNGLLSRIPPANTGVTSTATAANVADHILAGITTAERSFLPVDGIVLHPDDW